MRAWKPRLRTLVLVVGLAGLLFAAALHWFRGNIDGFNVVVSRSVPKGSTLADLEFVAGRATRPPSSDRAAMAMRRTVESNPGRYPDGWKEGDFWACYDFPDKTRWWFQVRDGRLVNYDPAVLASQPQRRVAAVR
jgi:hypothetical protein